MAGILFLNVLMFWYEHFEEQILVNIKHLLCQYHNNISVPGYCLESPWT